MRGSREKCIKEEKRKMLRYFTRSSRPTCKVLASGEISKDSLVSSWPGNREEVVKRGPRTEIRRSARRVASQFCLGEQ